MSGSRFFDTNVLYYACDNTDAAKQQTALELLNEATAVGDGHISTQVLGEFFSVTTRKKLLTAGEAVLAVRGFVKSFTVAPVEIPLVEKAMAIHLRYQTSYYDSLIIAAAAQQGCAEIVSEDLNDGQTYEGVRVRNPFQAAP